MPIPQQTDPGTRAVSQLGSADPSRFRVLIVQKDGTSRAGGVELLDEPAAWAWVDLQSDRPQDLAFLGTRFHFHPLALEDCAHLDQRPKLEEYGDHMFLVQHSFRRIGEAWELELNELHAFLGSDYLVTVHMNPIEPSGSVWERLQKDPVVAARGPDFALYLVSDRITDGHFHVLDELADCIEGLEDEILTRLQRRHIETIFDLKRALVTLRKTISPARDVMGVLSKRGDPRVSEKTALYFRDVYDHLMRVNETIEGDRDLLGNALDAYLSMAANHTNDIMKQLTLVSVTFLPLTFLTGFFGMNFTDEIPYGSWRMFYVFLAACIAIPALMLWLFLRKRWV